MKILFIYQKKMSFVARDLKILSERHAVREICFTGRKGLWHNIVPNLRELWDGVKWCDLTFSWFGKLHAYFAVMFSRILKKKSIVVSGGDDVASNADIGYGLFARRGVSWCPLYVFKNADSILSVSKSNYYETMTNAKAASAKVKLIYHGFEGDIFRRRPEIEKEPVILTVARITAETLIKKGLRLFVECAQLMPETKFLLVGPGDERALEKLKKIASPNVAFIGPLYGAKLVEIFSRAKVYAQLSGGESFGCAVAEAMLCECVPVLSRMGALPEVGGDAAIYIDSHEPDHVSLKLRQALASDIGAKARQRILEVFPLEKRRVSLLMAVENI